MKDLEVRDRELIVDVSGVVATITFNRPRVRNALKLSMWRELTELVRSLGERDDIRVVVFQGAGERAFAAGADIGEFDEVRADREQARRYTAAVEDTLNAIMDCPKPTVAKIRGACVGGGLEIAVACDVRVASQRSRLGLPIARIGVLAGWAELKRYVDLVGPAVTADLVLTARLLDAREAYDRGLLTNLVPDDALEAYVDNLAGRIAAGSPLTHRIHKRMLRILSEDPALVDLAPEEKQLPWVTFDSHDYREGVAAFLEKRQPTFTGP